MSQFSNKLGDLNRSAVTGGTLFSTVSGGLCTAVHSTDGPIVGPEGTLFGAKVSPLTCSAVCGAIGIIFGLVGELLATKSAQ